VVEGWARRIFCHELHELARRGEEKFEKFVAKGKHGGGLGLDGGRDGACERANEGL